MADETTDAALRYHRYPRPGKLEIVPTKPLATQRDLSLAYSPGVAAACNAIVADAGEVANLTVRGNLVAVITNGTAVLGLGAIGPLAAKPVMEGKAVLFKTFAGIDVFDIEIAETDPDRLVEVIAALEPTFGAVNLEDIKAPECFTVERALRQRMKIPVFHDDQHGTAIIVGAAVLNGLQLVGKDIGKVKLVCSGAGAAALACLDLLLKLGLDRANVWVSDIAGVVYEGRSEQMDPWKARYARRTEARTLTEIIGDADVFLGLSAGGVLKPDMAARMAPRPLILALANPLPEILPEAVASVRSDAIIATGRSDYPNQVNNVLCFPFIFRGALDVGATAITDAMEIACVRALARLAQAEPSDIAARAFGGGTPRFGPDQIIPRPFDPRLLLEIAPAVAQAAMESGVATRPIADLRAYRDRLAAFVFRSGLVMRPIFERAQQDPRRVIFGAGEDERVLRAAQALRDEKLAEVSLIGRPAAIRSRIAALGLQIEADRDVRIVDPGDETLLRSYAADYLELMRQPSATEAMARERIASEPTLLAALAVHRGEADAMIAGLKGRFHGHFEHVRDVIGLQRGARCLAALSLLVLPKRSFFLCDTYVMEDPPAEQIAEITILAVEEVRRFGLQPRVALLSHASAGGPDHASVAKMRRALELLRKLAPELEADGPMDADAALNDELRQRLHPGGRLSGPANLLVAPSLDAANIAFNLVKEVGDGLHVGPILVGTARPAHILTPSVTARGVLNMSVLAVTQAQRNRTEGS